jgi:riboflavin kinase / FMN adenylyltransferase
MIPPRPDSSFAVVRDGETVPARLKGGVVAIGNFDGVHRGHRAVIDEARARARATNVLALALTFEPHPRLFFRPQEPLFRLTPEPAKLRLLAAAGLDGVAVMRFGPELAALSAEAFISDALIGRFAITGVVVGADFHFGKNRAGTPEFLSAAGARHGFSVTRVAQLLTEGKPLSSGLVRAALAEGDMPTATALLGHTWFVEGTVIAGAQRGRALGVPTANIRLDPATGLKHGIFAVRVQRNGDSHDAVASFGRRPQFDNGAPLLEVFLFDFDADLYGQMLIVEFVAFIRAEMKFNSVEALVTEMKRDSDKARALLAQARTGKA